MTLQVNTSARGEESLADDHFAHGHFAEAEALYRRILQRDPGLLHIWSRLGRLALLANRPAEAVEHLAAAINKGLRTRENWELLAGAYLAKGDSASAALCYEKSGRSGLAGTLAVIAGQRDTNAEDGPVDESLDWLDADALPLIQAVINGVPINLLVDTAAGDLVLDAQVAITAGIPHGGQETRHFAGGRPARVTYGHLERLQLGSLAIDHLLCQIIDLGDRFEGVSPKRPIHGILGLSVLCRYLTVLDFKQRRLTLNSAITTMESHRHSSPFWIAEGHFMLVQAETPELGPSLWVLDTGMTGSACAMSPTTAKVEGLSPKARVVEQGLGGGGGVAARPVILPSLKLGDHRATGIEAMILESFPLEQRFGFPIAGLLGADFFQHRRLSLDFSQMRLHLA